MTVAFGTYEHRESGLHRLHPLTKLALTFFCLVAGLALPGLVEAYAVVLLVILPAAAWGKVLPRLLRAVLRIVLPFAISLALIQGLFWANGTPIVTLGPLSIKREGLLFALQSSGRILSVASGFLLLSLTTRPDALMIAMSQRGVPSSLTYIILTTIQIVPRFQAKAATILEAQRARGLDTEGGFARRVRAIVPLAIPLVLGSIVDIEERAIALEARAFGRRGPKTNLLELHDSKTQQLARALLLVATGLTLIASVLLRLPPGSGPVLTP